MSVKWVASPHLHRHSRINLEWLRPARPDALPETLFWNKHLQPSFNSDKQLLYHVCLVTWASPLLPRNQPLLMQLGGRLEKCHVIGQGWQNFSDCNYLAMTGPVALSLGVPDDASPPANISMLPHVRTCMSCFVDLRNGWTDHVSDYDTCFITDLLEKWLAVFDCTQSCQSIRDRLYCWPYNGHFRQYKSYYWITMNAELCKG